MLLLYLWLYIMTTAEHQNVRSGEWEIHNTCTFILFGCQKSRMLQVSSGGSLGAEYRKQFSNTTKWCSVEKSLLQGLSPGRGRREYFFGKPLFHTVPPLLPSAHSCFDSRLNSEKNGSSAQHCQHEDCCHGRDDYHADVWRIRPRGTAWRKSWSKWELRTHPIAFRGVIRQKFLRLHCFHWCCARIMPTSLVGSSTPKWLYAIIVPLTPCSLLLMYFLLGNIPAPCTTERRIAWGHRQGTGSFPSSKEKQQRGAHY